MLIAEICANVQVKSISQNFTYIVPERLKFLTAGWRVFVPFGGRKKIDGFVMKVEEVPDDTKFDFELKEITDVIDDESWFTAEMIFAARWLSDFYLCPLAQTMSLFMPGKVGRKINKVFEKIFKLKVESWQDENFSNAKAQKKILQILQYKKEIRRADFDELEISAAAMKSLVEKNFVEVEMRRVLRDSYAGIKQAAKKISLTSEQVAAIETVTKTLQKKTFKGFLLHGVTGSGKTQVYIELTKIVRKLGRRAVILVPEIALTGQIVQNFKAHFSDVAVIHSRLSVEERSDIFYKIRSGEVGIVIGARSALFTPIENVGLFVMDEEQDFSYKQDESPHYHARIVAEEFAKFHQAAIIFGSATPSLETYYRAKVGELIYLQLTHRALNQPLPEVELVDMRQELRRGNKNVLSCALQNLLIETVKNHQQAILLLNRRGYNTFVMCRACGEVIKCPDCGLTMAFHADGTLKCHHCDIEQDTPDICPKCGSKYIKFFGTGTQKLEQTLKMELPDARILRMDRDSTTAKFGHRKILNAFGRGEYDILFGTQMVAKGHDIQNVTAVGILSADSALNFPDFRAAENCFMLITQAAGRAGRANVQGKVVVQAYNVEADAVVFGSRQDYESFVRREILNRKKFFFPPYCRLVKIIFTDKNEKDAENFAKKIVAAFKDEVVKNSETRQEIFGPIPAMISKYKDDYRFAVLIKSTNLSAVKNFLRRHDLDKISSVNIDIDPKSTN